MTAVDVAGLCHWTANRGDIQYEQPSHSAYHYGSVCPYRAVADVLAGLPDPRDAVTEWRVPLPFRDGRPPMSLNDRYASYVVRNSRVHQVKKITRAALIAAHVPRLGHVHVELHWRPVDNRIRDEDNMVATLKPCIDAMHQPDEHSGWRPIIAGDDRRYVSWSAPMLHRPVKRLGPAVWLVLRSAEIHGGALATGAAEPAPLFGGAP